MSTAEVAQAVLLWTGVLVLVASAIGTTWAGTVLDRLHYMSLGAVAGLPLVLLSQIFAGPDQAPKLVIIALLGLVGSPSLTTATARALARRKEGS
ncbi:MAG TPA: monovalent cation/H(+) antiporter subunit G [Marmoricola sp.]|nr:monovalent cation/H(+) antiporter subunit G [Marmoricola sp.]